MVKRFKQKKYWVRTPFFTRQTYRPLPHFDKTIKSGLFSRSGSQFNFLFVGSFQIKINEQPDVITVGDKIKFPLCTDSPPTCERSCQQKSPKSRPKVASDFRCTLNVIKKVADLFLSGEKIVCTRIQTQVASMRKWNKKKLQFFLLESVTS